MKLSQSVEWDFGRTLRNCRVLPKCKFVSTKGKFKGQVCGLNCETEPVCGKHRRVLHTSLRTYLKNNDYDYDDKTVEKLFPDYVKRQISG